MAPVGAPAKLPAHSATGGARAAADSGAALGVADSRRSGEALASWCEGWAPGEGAALVMSCAFLQVSSWDRDLVAAYGEHYTQSKGAPPGRKIAWRIFTAGRARGWIVLGEPAFKLSPRRMIGITDARPLPHTVCCAIYRVDTRRDCEPSAGDILRMWHSVAAVEWAQRYGWQPIHWETMVDPAAVKSKNPGACFKRAGYRALGLTTGRSARRPAGHAHGARVWCDSSPKLVLYKGPLARQ